MKIEYDKMVKIMERIKDNLTEDNPDIKIEAF